MFFFCDMLGQLLTMHHVCGILVMWKTCGNLGGYRGGPNRWKDWGESDHTSSDRQLLVILNMVSKGVQSYQKMKRVARRSGPYSRHLCLTVYPAVCCTDRWWCQRKWAGDDGYDVTPLWFSAWQAIENFQTPNCRNESHAFWCICYNLCTTLVSGVLAGRECMLQLVMLPLIGIFVIIFTCDIFQS